MATDTSWQAGIFNTGLVQGTYFAKEITLKADGVKVDLTGATVTIKIRNSSGAVVRTYTNSAGITITDSVIMWEILSADSATIPISDYTYKMDVKIGLESKEYLEGTFTVEDGL